MERLSLTDQVAASIRDEILSGELAPGASLREQAIGERFGVGRSTVREAIRALVGEGLVQHAHHRGAVVTQHRVEDLDDLIAARLMIERQVATADLGDLAGAEQQLVILEQAVERGDWLSAARADEAFHRAVVEALGSPRISAFHAQLSAEMRLLLLTADRQEPEVDKLAEHRRLFDLLRAGDGDGYLEAATHHVSRSRTILVRVLRRAG